MPALRRRRLLDGEHEKRELLRVLLARLQLAVSDSAERHSGGTGGERHVAEANQLAPMKKQTNNAVPPVPLARLVRRWPTCTKDTQAMKVIELPTLARHSPVLECENCGRQSLICQLHRRANSRRLFCHCGKDSIILPQNASDWKITRNTEHESTGEPIGRDGLGDFSSTNNGKVQELSGGE